MSKIKVRLTTEIHEGANATNVFPYNYNKDYIKAPLSGKKKLIIHDFYMENASRVEIFWNQPETTNILYGPQELDIPVGSREMILVLDPFVIDNRNNIIVSNERVAEFEFELQ